VSLASEMLHQPLQRWFELVNTTFVNGGPFTPKSVASILEIDLDTTIQYGIAVSAWSGSLGPPLLAGRVP
jgi:hypothetical protein